MWNLSTIWEISLQKLKVVNEERELELIISNTLKSGVQKLLNQSIPH